MFFNIFVFRFLPIPNIWWSASNSKVSLTTMSIVSKQHHLFCKLVISLKFVLNLTINLVLKIQFSASSISKSRLDIHLHSTLTMQLFFGCVIICYVLCTPLIRSNFSFKTFHFWTFLNVNVDIDLVKCFSIIKLEMFHH